MPIYEYQCRSCKSRFEQMRAMSNRLSPPDCPACDGDRTSLAMSVPGRVGATGPEVAADVCGMGEGSCCGGVCLN